MKEQNEKEVLKPSFASLDDLLSVNPDDAKYSEENVELVNGKVIKLPIKSITADKEAEIRKAATKYITTPKGRFPQLDDLRYNVLIIEAGTDSNRTDINWKDPNLAKKLGAPVPNPEFTIPKLLSLGGLSKASLAIIELSGLDSSFEDKVEAVKN